MGRQGGESLQFDREYVNTVLFRFATDIGAHPGMHLDRGRVRREVLSQVHSG